AQFERLLVIARREDIVARDRGDLALAAQLGPRFSRGKRMATVAPTLDPVRALFAGKQEMDWIEAPDPIDWLARNLQPTDLPLFVGLAAAREALRRVPSLVDGRCLAIQGPARAPARQRPGFVVSPIIAGRSLKPRPA
ncbi:MAG TPA: hypothetical protein VHG72_02005, partial [Polyangia bacterium]|nr:hypothetical protein [Polyangia bacterium]